MGRRFELNDMLVIVLSKLEMEFARLFATCFDALLYVHDINAK